LPADVLPIDDARELEITTASAAAMVRLGPAYGFMEAKGPQAAVEYGAAHGALAMTHRATPRWSREEVEAVMKGKGARVIR
jgi:hypothetical protein